MTNRITDSQYNAAIQASIATAKSYGVVVVFEDLPIEFNGALTGDTIILNGNDTYEMQLFTIAYLLIYLVTRFNGIVVHEHENLESKYTLIRRLH